MTAETYRGTRCRRAITSRLDRLHKYLDRHCLQPATAHKLLREIHDELHNVALLPTAHRASPGNAKLPAARPRIRKQAATARRNPRSR